jgi:hypothetical protein
VAGQGPHLQSLLTGRLPGRVAGCPQSSSTSRFTDAHAGFFILTQCRDRPSASSTLIHIKIRHPLWPQISMCRVTYVPALAPPWRGFFWNARAASRSACQAGAVTTKRRRRLRLRREISTPGDSIVEHVAGVIDLPALEVHFPKIRNDPWEYLSDAAEEVCLGDGKTHRAFGP